MNGGLAMRGIPRGLWVLLGLGLTGYAVYELRGVLTPIFIAFLIAYLLDPLVDRFEERKIPRALGIVILLVLVLGGFALVLLLVVPGVVRETVQFGHELPHKLEGVWATLEPVLERYDVPVPHTMDDVRGLLGSGGEGGEGGELPAAELAGRAATVLGTVGRWVLGGTASALSIVSSLLIVPVLAFYLLYDFDRITASIRDLVPHRYRPFVVDVATEVDEVLGQFIRGQLLVMVILAVLYAIAYSIAGIRLAIPIGIIAGLLSFIPYVGGAAALVLALLMCLLSWNGWWQVGGVVIGYTVIQILEGFVITPRIVGDKVGLPAVWVLVALMIGGELFGFLGVLLAVPAAAVAKIFVVRAVAYYRKSSLYLEGGHPERAKGLARLLEEEGLPDTPDVAREKARAFSGDAEGDGEAGSGSGDADTDEDADIDEDADADEADADEDDADEDDADEDDADEDDADEDDADEDDSDEDDSDEDAEPDEDEDTAEPPPSKATRARPDRRSHEDE